MTDISFYHLTTRSLEDALPKLLELSLQSEERALVLLGNEERMEFLNGLLWTYEPGSWLPHGTLEDGDPADQPIFLTSRDENLNEATFLFLVDGARVSGEFAGNLDFNMLNLSNIDKIEIIEGGMSSLYGSSAIGLSLIHI